MSRLTPEKVNSCTALAEIINVLIKDIEKLKNDVKTLKRSIKK